MFERDILASLKQWKNDTHRKPLVLRGARQVGKTFIIKQFANEYYESIIYINFIENDSYKEIFDGNLDVENIIKQIILRIPNVYIIPNKTILAQASALYFSF